MSEATGHLEWLYRFEARFTDWVVIGAVPEGLRYDAHFAGQVTEGELSGATIRGIDYLLLRADGVGVLDVREVLTRDGISIDIRPGGYFVPPPGFSPPEPDVMASPDFSWPALDFPLHGFATFRTAATDWRWLNHAIGVFTGVANPGAGTLDIDAQVFVPVESPRLTAAVAVPAGPSGGRPSGP